MSVRTDTSPPGPLCFKSIEFIKKQTGEIREQSLFKVICNRICPDRPLSKSVLPLGSARQPPFAMSFPFAKSDLTKGQRHF